MPYPEIGRQTRHSRSLRSRREKYLQPSATGIELLRIVIIMLILGWVHSAQAEDRAAERLFWLTSTSLIVVDWLQTREIVHNPRFFELTNPVVSAHPRHVDTFYATALIGHWLIHNRLPRRQRIWYGAFITGTELSAVWANYRLGIHLRF